MGWPMLQWRNWNTNKGAEDYLLSLMAEDCLYLSHFIMVRSLSITDRVSFTGATSDPNCNCAGCDCSGGPCPQAISAQSFYVVSFDCSSSCTGSIKAQSTDAF